MIFLTSGSKNTDDGRPLCKLSPVNNAIVAILATYSFLEWKHFGGSGKGNTEQEIIESYKIESDNGQGYPNQCITTFTV